MNKKVVTGACGRIGRIVSEDLAKMFNLFVIDKEVGQNSWDNGCAYNIATYDHLPKLFVGASAVVHLAWDSRENWKSTEIVPENKTMAENVYRAAVQAKVPRVIMASSIHAHLLASPYGATKKYIEALGRYYAIEHNLEVVCIRFGGIDPEDKLRDEPNYRQVFLSRRDCASLIAACLSTEKVPDNFCTIYGVSDNKSNPHSQLSYSWTNPFGWAPQDNGFKI